MTTTHTPGKIVLTSGIVGDHDGVYDYVRDVDYDKPEYTLGFHDSAWPEDRYTVIVAADRDDLITDYGLSEWLRLRGWRREPLPANNNVTEMMALIKRMTEHFCYNDTGLSVAARALLARIEPPTHDVR